MSIFNIFKKKPETGKKIKQKIVHPETEKEIKKGVERKIEKEIKEKLSVEEKKEELKIKEPKQEKGARVITRSGRVPIKRGAKKEKVGKKGKAETAEKAKLVKPKKAVKSAVAWKALEKPHITEKATDLTRENEYAFTVSMKANKVEIKKAVEDVYGVNVEKVRIINIPAKKRRMGKTEGWRRRYKKAIVRIKKGQEIEVLPR